MNHITCAHNTDKSSSKDAGNLRVDVSMSKTRILYTPQSYVQAGFDLMATPTRDKSTVNKVENSKAKKS